MTDVYAQEAKRLIELRFRQMWSNDDDLKRRAGHALLDGAYTFVEEDGVHRPSGTSTLDSFSSAAK